jgi:7-keto-8-aminopelargonate synthetase-like enzyme
LEAEPERIKRLWDNAQFMKDGFIELGLSVGNSQTPVVPVMTWEDLRTFKIARELLDEGVYVNPVITPAVKPGNSLLRTSYTSTHTREQLEFALAAFKKVFERN